MRNTILAALGAGALMTISMGAQALPLAQGVDSPSAVQDVRMGCGPGFTPVGPRGRCVRMMRPGPRYVAPRHMGPRCVVRPTAHGPRRFCR